VCLTKLGGGACRLGTGRPTIYPDRGFRPCGGSPPDPPSDTVGIGKTGPGGPAASLMVVNCRIIGNLMQRLRDCGAVRRSVRAGRGLVRRTTAEYGSPLASAPAEIQNGGAFLKQMRCVFGSGMMRRSTRTKLRLLVSTGCLCRISCRARCRTDGSCLGLSRTLKRRIRECPNAARFGDGARPFIGDLPRRSCRRGHWAAIASRSTGESHDQNCGSAGPRFFQADRRDRRSTTTIGIRSSRS
jgi:hypothetical protein